MKYLSILLFAFMFSCGNERIVELPIIANANITDIQDVSAAYVFYDETQPDSTEFNRRNIISTTNWLVNIDKRLSLKQAMPHILFLQEKRRGAQMHKNALARNYYTCNDTSIKNLGFIDFTDVVYSNNTDKINFKHLSKIDSTQINIYPDVFENQQVKIIIYNGDGKLGPKTMSYLDFLSYLSSFENQSNNIHPNVYLSFSKEISFQEYISFKSLISELESDNITISNNETIY